MTRSAAHHDADTRRVVKGHNEEWLRGYIARHAMRMIIADQALADQGFQRMLAKSLIEALKQMRSFAGRPTGRQHKPRIPDLEASDAADA